jgi:hypothetical protein
LAKAGRDPASLARASRDPASRPKSSSLARSGQMDGIRPGSGQMAGIRSDCRRNLADRIPSPDSGDINRMLSDSDTGNISMVVGCLNVKVDCAV